jgi:hypothetical protein
MSSDDFCHPFIFFIFLSMKNTSIFDDKQATREKVELNVAG